MTISYCIIIILKNEPLGRIGCCNKLRWFTFRLLRVCLLTSYLYGLSMFLGRVIPETWHLTKTVVWTTQDDLNIDSFSYFNYLFNLGVWLMIMFVAYIYIFVLAVYVLVFVILLAKGQWSELKKLGTILMLFGKMFWLWIKTTITNESLAIEVARMMGSHVVQDDNFKSPDVREDFLKMHTKGYGEIENKEKCSQCSICILDFEPADHVVELKCKHLFHPACFDDYLQLYKANSKQCPNCRTEL